jgi:hypothetical protein
VPLRRAAMCAHWILRRLQCCLLLSAAFSLPHLFAADVFLSLDKQWASVLCSQWK